ncbi:MAG: hypothetical protein IPI44_24660 [Sulfuritalea sp.]|nr:hypothetical protein [Sulfuritalea sp.]MBK8119053.1 hypothetical protein [Sulfuritalea sp.]
MDRALSARGCGLRLTGSGESHERIVQTVRQHENPQPRGEDRQRAQGLQKEMLAPPEAG